MLDDSQQEYVPVPDSEESVSSVDRTRTKVRSRKFKLIGGMIVVLIVIGGGLFWKTSSEPSLERAYSNCKDPVAVVRRMLQAESGGMPDDELEEESSSLGGVVKESVEGVLSVEDGGKTLVVQTKSKEDDPLGAGAGLILGCVYDELNAPERVRESVAQTRALDGRQEDTWGSFMAQWSYHPDRGLSMIVSKK